MRLGTIALILRRHWPLALALALLWLAIAALLAASLAATGGRVVYALDDPYIHMAMAKNLAQHRVLGVSRYEFTSTTSSPLWTLLLALLFAAAGVRDEIPLLVNLALASCRGASCSPHSEATEPRRERRVEKKGLANIERRDR